MPQMQLKRFIHITMIVSTIAVIANSVKNLWKILEMMIFSQNSPVKHVSTTVEKNTDLTIGLWKHYSNVKWDVVMWVLIVLQIHLLEIMMNVNKTIAEMHGKKCKMMNLEYIPSTFTKNVKEMPPRKEIHNV